MKFRHPFHPIVAHVPAAAWPAALVFDLLSQFGSNALVRLSFYSILLGLVVALIAVPTGVLDWANVKKEKPAWKLGLYHMMLNLFGALVFAVNLGLRWDTYRDETHVGVAPLLLSVIGAAIIVYSAYLGGRMVFHHGVAVARYSKDKLRAAAEAGGANVPPKEGG
jgi:uncharacterized membrane protein